MRNIKFYILPIVLLFISCSKPTEDFRERQAKLLYRESIELFKEGEYNDAILKFKEVLKYIDYLTPEQIKEIKYKLALSYYRKEDYINAVIFLEDFIMYYPKAKEAEYAYYILVDSYFRIAPDAYRDQSYTNKAIEKAKEFLIRFPKSNYTDEITDIMEKAFRKIAMHEYLIARFYEDYGYHYSAAKRYKELLINSYEYIDEEEVAYRYIKNLLLTKDQAEKEIQIYRKLIETTRKKLKEEKMEKKKIKNRIEFLHSQINRWREVYKQAEEEASESMKKYLELYGRNEYYIKLEEWKN